LGKRRKINGRAGKGVGIQEEEEIKTERMDKSFNGEMIVELDGVEICLWMVLATTVCKSRERSKQKRNYRWGL